MESLGNLELAGWAVGGAAAFGLVASCWSYVRSLWQQVSSRIIVHVRVSGYESDAVQLFLKEQFEASRFGPRHYTGWLLHVQPRNRTQLVPMEVIGSDGRLFWKGWRPIWVAKKKDDSVNVEEGVTARDWESETLTVTFFRGLFDPDEFVTDASEYFNDRMVSFGPDGDAVKRRHYVKHVYGTAGKNFAQFRNTQQAQASAGDTRSCMHHRPVGWDISELGFERSEADSAVDQLALSQDALEMVEEAMFWKDNEGWYRGRGIPWRRGWLLHGIPGTGKTALIRAIAEDLDLPVFVYDVASLFNEEFQQAWSSMLSEVPCMAVIEDIDAVFDGRKNITGREQHLTFDCLLSCLDGIERSNGLFVVITTNRIERIDPALGRPGENSTESSRPGRIDRVLELGALDEAARRKLAKRILEDWPECIAEVVENGDGDTGARFQERCTREALARLWQRESDSESSAVLRSRERNGQRTSRSGQTASTP